ncbi:YicC/YloC family endoribonuclease [Asticcacaulis sp. 201]|uniref:YicC/YloC family endoribonuclease n=1 Tax=Asticcacaulis sp. 201 TaxID=3028787 RepID=UPI00291703CB|nr:YicC/YloC family endoribonuclease [Asticcacaulis sp. 201]MDV6329499.1 YicC/YloC family endoribonuclease [Asticcacaulis sp. 201]
MSLSSMTGFARVEGGEGETAWTVEIRSVNGRGLDIKSRFPAGFEIVEKVARELAKGRFQRGQMNLTVSVAGTGAKAGVSINMDVLDMYLAAGRKLVDAGDAVTPSVDGLLALRGVIDASGDERDELSEASAGALSGDLAVAFDRLKEARDGEGRALEGVLKGHLIAMAACVERAKSLADGQVDAIRERFTRRLNELLPESGDFHERVLQEAALLATKADVREELDRLTSHLDQAHQLIDGEVAPGRKLDFLAQEFMREANTLCSKSAFIELTQTGLELKAVIDQFREQTQNVE